MPEHEAPVRSPGVYRIRVEGSLDPSWSDRLGGLAITTTGKFGSKTTTVLEGTLADQSALMGVLNTLHDLHLPVEAVECLSSGERMTGTATHSPKCTQEQQPAPRQ